MKKVILVLILVIFVFVNKASSYAMDSCKQEDSGTMSSLLLENTLGQKNDPYLIFTADQLLEFEKMVNGTSTKKGNPKVCATLMADIDLRKACSTNQWNPIGNISKPYTGIFDGNNHKICGLSVKYPHDIYVGMFKAIGPDGQVKNLTLSGSIINADLITGGISSVNNGLIYGCKCEDLLMFARKLAGGICGQNYGTIQKCSVSGKISVSGRFSGGICGENKKEISECENNAIVYGIEIVGGICAKNLGNIRSCENFKYLKGKFYFGGVCGINNSYIQGCKNLAKIQGESFTGGICGVNQCVVSNCLNRNNVYGSCYVGGIAGNNFSHGIIIKSCNYGVVYAYMNCAGGICGINDGMASIECCSNKNRIGLYQENLNLPLLKAGFDRGWKFTDLNTNRDYIGGICGLNKSGSIRSSINWSFVVGKFFVGGICGSNKEGELSNCVNLGSAYGEKCVSSILGQRFFLFDTQSCYTIGNAVEEKNQDRVTTLITPEGVADAEMVMLDAFNIFKDMDLCLSDEIISEVIKYISEKCEYELNIGQN